MTHNPIPIAADKLVSKPQAAEILGVSVRTIEREINAGHLTKKKVRGCVRLHLSQVLRFADLNPTPV